MLHTASLDAATIRSRDSDDGAPGEHQEMSRKTLPATLPAAAAANREFTAPPEGELSFALPYPGRGRGLLRAALATMRPRQWIKNGLVVAAAGAAGALSHDDVPIRVGLACVAFCLLSSAVYAINDVRDASEDRLHPEKRHRPVAAGELAPGAGIALGIGLAASGLALCAVARPLVALVGFGYVALTLSYTLLWRHIAVLDIFAIAGGFVLRALAGGVAAPVALSRWFVLVITCGAVFVAAAKRLAELLRTSDARARHRRALHGYSEWGLRWLLRLSGAGMLIAYCIWAFELPAVRGIPWRPLTVIPFALCVLRYSMLIRAGVGEAPEDLVLGDRLLMLAGAMWLVLFAVSVNAAG
jgi:decaprenyl-phosphate phosphoribosyltransferase